MSILNGKKVQSPAQVLNETIGKRDDKAYKQCLNTNYKILYEEKKEELENLKGQVEELSQRDNPPIIAAVRLLPGEDNGFEDTHKAFGFIDPDCPIVTLR